MIKGFNRFSFWSPLTEYEDLNKMKKIFGMVRSVSYTCLPQLLCEGAVSCEAAVTWMLYFAVHAEYMTWKTFMYNKKFFILVGTRINTLSWINYKYQLASALGSFFTKTLPRGYCADFMQLTQSFFYLWQFGILYYWPKCTVFFLVTCEMNMSLIFCYLLH